MRCCSEAWIGLCRLLDGQYLEKYRDSYNELQLWVSTSLFHSSPFYFVSWNSLSILYPIRRFSFVEWYQGQWRSQHTVKVWAPFSQHRPLFFLLLMQIQVEQLPTIQYSWSPSILLPCLLNPQNIPIVPKPLLLLRLLPFHMSCGNRDKLYSRGSASGGSCGLGLSRDHSWPPLPPPVQGAFQGLFLHWTVEFVLGAVVVQHFHLVIRGILHLHLQPEKHMIIWVCLAVKEIVF